MITEQDAAMEDFLERALKEISEQNVKDYLGTYSDATTERVDRCRTDANRLSDLGFHGSAVVRAVTGIELIIRYMLILPIVQAAFLSGEWAEILSKRIIKGRSVEDRSILPVILRQRGIDISTVTLGNGSPLWDGITNCLLKKRNAFVHKAELCEANDVQFALECLEVLIVKVVHAIARNLGFTLERTGVWADIEYEDGLGGGYAPCSPF